MRPVVALEWQRNLFACKRMPSAVRYIHLAIGTDLEVASIANVLLLALLDRNWCVDDIFCNLRFKLCVSIQFDYLKIYVCSETVSVGSKNRFFSICKLSAVSR